MGLTDKKCDSCDLASTVLFPAAVIEKLTGGGEAMVQRWYCWSCHLDLQTESESAEESEEKPKEEDDDQEEEDDEEEDNN